MNREEIESYALARVDASKDMLAEVDILLKSGHLRGAVNRIYYSMFQLVATLATLKGFEIKRHRSAQALLHKEFINTGIIAESLGETYSQAAVRRERSDYSAVVYEASEVGDLYGKPSSSTMRLGSSSWRTWDVGDIGDRLL